MQIKLRPATTASTPTDTDLLAKFVMNVRLPLCELARCSAALVEKPLTNPSLYFGAGTGMADPPDREAGKISKIRSKSGLSVALWAVWVTSPDS